MIVFPNSKINLGLHILRKRTDGYHDLETVFYPLPLTDALEIIPLGSHENSTSFPFTISGAELKGSPGSNLCVRACQLLKKDFPNLPGVMMHLHKTIPSGAGLGGGSADAAFTLQLLNKMFSLRIPTTQLLVYANELGSDCPFFIINKPCYASGRGELLEEVQLDLSHYQIVVVNPGIHIDTRLAFLNITAAMPEKSIKEIILRPIEKWKDELHNDFEKVIFEKHPEIAELKYYLYGSGALYASMSGSGSTVFGIYPGEKSLQFSFPPHYFVRTLSALK
jgi:4-diphosphocytidyl-2-C-methyl-D-erythritol kinase